VLVLGDEVCVEHVNRHHAIVAERRVVVHARLPAVPTDPTTAHATSDRTVTPDARAAPVTTTADIAPGDSAAAVRSVTGADDVRGDERRLSTDHANVSICVDDRWVVKWFAAPRTRSDLALVDHLTAAGFEHMPRHLGALARPDPGATIGHAGADRADERIVAVVSEYVPDVRDGWEWYVDDVIAWIDGSTTLEALVDSALRLGAITAALHECLADTARRASLDHLRADIDQRHATAVDQVVRGGRWPDEAERLRRRLARIDGTLALLDTGDDVDVQWTHGDLHAGQFLRDRHGRIVLTDFDGDPFADTGAKVVVAPCERDVASLVQSLDHVGRVAARRRPGSSVESFVAAAIAAALDAYRARRPLRDHLLWPLRVAQELHEYAYAATRLPVWMYVPDQAMTALFPDPEDTPR
jgi:maltokinase